MHKASFSDLLVVVLVRIFHLERGQLVAVLIVAGEGKVKIASLAKKKLNCMLGKEKFELQAWQRNSSPLLVLELLQVAAPLLLLLVLRTIERIEHAILLPLTFALQMRTLAPCVH